MIARFLFRFFRECIAASGLIWLVACAPVQDSVRQEWNPLDYTVKPGDTLYSIAWRYELDYKELARWNDIGPPYSIYPGQRLNMAADSAEGSYGHDVVTPEASDDVVAATLPEQDESAAPDVVDVPEPEGVPEKSRPSFVIVKAGDTLYSIARDYQIEPVQLARWNALKPPYALRTGQKIILQPPGFAQAFKPPVPVIKPVKPVAPEKKPAVKPVTRPVVESDNSATPVKGWRWPARGKIVKTFNPDDTARKGIGIAGKMGQPVLAAAPGKVVYSGNGLISYGNLIIIKHDDEYLSAYAHNQDLLVKEGDDVAAGQTIASMGLDEGKPRLHFEIRKQGKPVNPLKYLPSG